MPIEPVNRIHAVARQVLTTGAVLAAVISAGFVMGVTMQSSVAAANIASGPWKNFAVFGATPATRRCLAQQAEIYNRAAPVAYEPGMTGSVRNSQGTPCSAKAVPVSHIAVLPYVVRMGDGAICRGRGWTFNNSSTHKVSASVLGVRADAGGCSVAQGKARGKVWRPATETYQESSTFSFSPEMNYQ